MCPQLKSLVNTITIPGRYDIQRAAIFVVFAWTAFVTVAQPAASSHPPATIQSIENRVEYGHGTNWYPAKIGTDLFVGDRVATRRDSRATVELEDISVVRMNPESELVVTPPRSAGTKATIDVPAGLLYFLHRNEPKAIDVTTPVASATIEGTEFILKVDPVSKATALTLIDGRVRLANDHGEVVLTNGELGTVERGQAPHKSPALLAQDAVQWWLYYPAVLDPNELHLDAATATELGSSLAAYRSGDLIAAFTNYPTGRQPASEGERIYINGLRLSCGLVTNFDQLRAENLRSPSLGNALNVLIAAVTREHLEDSAITNNASQLLACSYYRQAQHDLSGALTNAQLATKASPEFGFAWERVAELQFSFGRIGETEAALEKVLRYSPRNAQAHALRGFVYLARNRFEDAEREFAFAIEIDPMLSNAWLGRGLGKIRTGRVTEGRKDIEAAAVLEPKRWVLRSYLGKAFAHESIFVANGKESGDLHKLAFKELDLAKEREPLDPTPWLYSALLNYDEYRTAEAIEGLQKSQRLNNNRQIYRSALMLDEDQAVRSANLANIFHDAGMTGVSVHESARAVSFDYANYSAHLNLASSFNQLRDPTRFNLRYESEWFNEHLLANLLAPVGASSLSQNLSQQEYSRLFATDRIGFSSTTEYFSDKRFFETASQFGTIGNTAYALDLEYQHNEGTRPNNDLSRIEWYSRVKQQLTPDDSVLLLTKYQDYSSGDNFQHYNPDIQQDRTFRYDEMQTPLLLAGYHHQWAPGVDTLILAGRLENDQRFIDRPGSIRFEFLNPRINPTNLQVNLVEQNQWAIYTAELNQIIQKHSHTEIFGARFQTGDIEAHGTAVNSALPFSANTSVDVRFQRISPYFYHHWEIRTGLLLIAGLSFDNIRYPANFRLPPLENREAERNRLSPKAALIWTPGEAVTVRAVYTRFTGGMSYDESVRLEPTQLAGFSQSFRSVISESVAGSVTAPDYELGGAALDLKLGKKSWLSFRAEDIREYVNRDIGVGTVNLFAPEVFGTANTREILDYDEVDAGVTYNQIFGTEWFLEGDYQFSRSRLHDTLPDISGHNIAPFFVRTVGNTADLHEWQLALTWQNPSGFFCRSELWWYLQNLGGSVPQPPGDEFPQLNLYVGYRFPRRHGEIVIGGMNLTGEDYHLSPLNYYLELPRDRIFYTRLKVNF